MGYFSKHISFALRNNPKLAKHLSTNKRVQGRVQKLYVPKFIAYSTIWCKKHLGESSRHVYEVDIQYDKTASKSMTKNRYGEYESETNTIFICVSCHRSWQNLASTFIHEWVHHLQTPSWYTRYFDMGYSYEDHPYEREASYLGDKLSGPCTLFALTKMRLL